VSARFADWIGREEVQHDTITLAPARGLAALLDRDPDSVALAEPLPALWHWIYFNRAVRQSELGDDGHARRGGFLPPVQLPRRMWAGGRLQWLAPLRIGDTAERRSVVRGVEEKTGRSGALVIVTIQHSIGTERGAAIEETQQILYRERTAGDTSVRSSAASKPAAREMEWSASFQPTPVALYRFSALTSNAHRIHYDHPYTTQAEGYPGLLVHAPLTALLLLDEAVERAPRRALSYEYRALAPLFADTPITLQGALNSDAQMDVWASDPDGTVAMRATVDW
jgi:3-methylfumaryl-CoA hydratase